MRIQEVCRQLSATKKAVTYNIEQGLISPAVLDNGYRDFSPEDVERLRKIMILRKLGLGTGEIKNALAERGELWNERVRRASPILRQARPRAGRSNSSSVDTAFSGAAHRRIQGR